MSKQVLCLFPMCVFKIQMPGYFSSKPNYKQPFHEINILTINMLCLFLLRTIFLSRIYTTHEAKQNPVVLRLTKLLKSTGMLRVEISTLMLLFVCQPGANKQKVFLQYVYKRWETPKRG